MKTLILICLVLFSVPTRAETPYIIMQGHGDSMLPVIKTGQSLKLVYKKFSEIKLDDICWYRSHGDNVVHRVVKKNLWPRGWIMRGDNNEWSDTELMTSFNYVCVIIPLEQK